MRVGALLVGAAALALAACQPVAGPPPDIASCEAPPDQDHDGAVEYFAVVDDGQAPGLDEAVPFEAASQSEKSSDVAQIEATQGDVIAVEPNYPVTSEAIDDPGVGHQWGIATAGFEGAWANVAANGDAGSSNGTGVLIAVLDTGVQSSHEDLSGGVVAGFDFIDPHNSSNFGTIDLGTTSHGTHVAGIAGARDNITGGIGGAPGATIMSIRVLNSAGSGSYAALINGINHAVGSGADVISMSLGGTTYSPQLEFQVTNAHAKGVVVVAAAGNNGTCAAHYPAAMPGAIAVAATQPDDTLASFSQRGSWVDIAAPGAGIWSTVNSGYGTKSGTSMATPFVSAAAALIIDMCPGYAPTSVEARLQATSVPIAGQPIESGSLRASTATAGPC
jgi:thermitase